MITLRGARRGWRLPALCFVLCLALGATDPAPVATQSGAEALAARGDLAAAIAAWRGALDAGAVADPYTARIRIAELERDLGRPLAGLADARAALALARGSGNRAREAAAQGVVGSLLRAAGRLDEASNELTLAEAAARSSGAGAVLAVVLSERARLAGDRGQVEAARQLYGEAAALAAANALPLLRFDALVERAALALAGPAQAASAAALLDEARALATTLPATHAATLARVRLARTTVASANAAGPEQADRLLRLARSDLEDAGAAATSMHDAGAESWVLGTRAELENAAGRPDRAEALAGEALRAARQARLAEAELRWEALLGRLMKQRGDFEGALPHLRRAGDLLAERRASRGAFATASPGPGAEIDRDLVDVLLLRSGDQEGPARQRALRDAQSTMERFRVSELRDYFHDECVDAYREKITDPASASQTAAVLYPIVLDDRVEILLATGGRIERLTTPVSRDALERVILELRQLLVKRTTHQYLRPARKLYDWLIADALARLDPESVDTLVFVPDGLLRTIPMSALHDGESFLVERFAVATTPGLELTDPRPIGREKMQAFVGGLSESVDGFPELAHVRQELASVAAETGATPLLDSGFTTQRILRTLEGKEFSVVHMATHGQFSSTPEDTFLLTYDGRLQLAELAAAVGAYRYRETPLELLLLSACETAVGDERSALGLSGVAIQAGARSAVGSLWRVNDAATQQLIEGFYAKVVEAGTSRAEALREAQLALLADARYRHPFYWAPFLLIGSWL